jgi:transcriptional regulator of acetoin/glycerol metabolism
MDLGLYSGAALCLPVLEAAELARRRDRAAFVRKLAQAELETLSQQIAGSNFLLAFADDEGVILDLYADNRFSMSGSGAGIVAGSCWTESVAGTNGLGTALASGKAVAVSGLEHYFTQLGQISCTAAPVHDAMGVMVGVLDASSLYESRQRHTQALVQMAATHIENGLLTHQMRGRLVLAVHPRAEFLSTLSAGLVAFDADGVLQALNGPARGLLSGLNVQRGAEFEILFGETLDQALARLQLQSEVRLRDCLGSVLVARMVCRPFGPSASTPAPARPAPSRPQASASAAPSRRTAAAAAAVMAPDFVADDPDVQAACRLVEAAVRMRVPVLLQGETGTGKELLARHAHRVSGRRGEFVAVNCAAMPAELFEAELFGYVGGAFSGARRDGSEGLIRAADGGTLLLDEVRELPLSLQASLLRFLDDRQVRPVGGRGSVAVDVQLLAASHANLEDEVRARTFRQDLLYRLNTVQVLLPPLRLRRDLAQAARWALCQIDPDATITDDALQGLSAHLWPGNFRELRSVLTRLLLAQTGTRQPISLPQVQAQLPGVTAPGSVLQRSASVLVRDEFERSGRSVSQTSRKLGISRTTVYRHLRA